MSRYRGKTELHLESIPPELCTAEEAKKILGMKSYLSFNKERYKNLRYTYAVWNNYRVILYNRAEVEALKLPDGPPDGWITVKQAAPLLGQFGKCAQENTLAMLKRAGLQGRMFTSRQNHRAHFIYKRADVEALAEKRKVHNNEN